jgi:putative ABC transport system permease protein
MMVSIYNSMSERKQEIALMRALGARRLTVMTIILLESILLSLGGGVLGLLLGHMLIGGMGPWISEYTGIVIRVWDFQVAELILIPGLILLASVVGFLPAAVAYKQDVATSLAP